MFDPQTKVIHCWKLWHLYLPTCLKPVKVPLLLNRGKFDTFDRCQQATAEAKPLKQIFIETQTDRLWWQGSGYVVQSRVSTALHPPLSRFRKQQCCLSVSFRLTGCSMVSFFCMQVKTWLHLSLSQRWVWNGSDADLHVDLSSGRVTHNNLMKLVAQTWFKIFQILRCPCPALKMNQRGTQTLNLSGVSALPH